MMQYIAYSRYIAIKNAHPWFGLLGDPETAETG